MAAGIWNGVWTLLFGLAAVFLVLRWLAVCGLPLGGYFAAPAPRHRGEVPGRGELVRVFWIALAFRLVWALLLFRVYQWVWEIDLSQLPSLWIRWDAQHYLKLAELGYSGYTEGGQHLFLVFFPLYVWLVRALGLVLPDLTLCGLAVSWLCFAWGSVYFYRLICGDYGSATAQRALLLLWAYPFSFFFGGIMTESLFFLTTAAAFSHIRGHRWGRAALWGVLAALTRMQGLLLVGAAVAELCQEEQPFLSGNRQGRREVFRKLPLLFAPVLGSLGYLLLNWQVAGDPFAFTVMERHWSQGFQWFPKVLWYVGKNAMTWTRRTARWEIWVPELILFPLFALLLAASWRRHRAMYPLYAFVYLILNYSLSWLLSAGRYLACGLPFFLFAADWLEERPVLTALLTGGMFLLQGVFCFRYFCWGQVM